MPRHQLGHRVLRVCAAIALYGVIGACAQSGTRAAAAPPREPPANYVRPTRSGPECDSVRLNASTSRAEDTVGMQKPLPRTLVVMPIPFPPALEGRPLRFLYRVDERGAVMADSVEIVGSIEHPYNRDMRRSVARFVYWPAVRDGCAVSARTEIRMQLGGTPPRR